MRYVLYQCDFMRTGMASVGVTEDITGFVPPQDRPPPSSSSLSILTARTMKVGVSWGGREDDEGLQELEPGCLCDGVPVSDQFQTGFFKPGKLLCRICG